MCVLCDYLEKSKKDKEKKEIKRASLPSGWKPGDEQMYVPVIDTRAQSRLLGQRLSQPPASVLMGTDTKQDTAYYLTVQYNVNDLSPILYAPDIITRDGVISNWEAFPEYKGVYNG